MTTAIKSLTLTEFLQLPETKPASEFINNSIYQKPMPQGKHSTLQLRLAEAINQVGVSQTIADAFPELRCTFGGRSIVPDIAVVQWPRIPFNVDGDVANIFELAPDWTIEILSPDQSQTRVTDNILFCLDHGTSLGWLIDPREKAVICFRPNQQPMVIPQTSGDLPGPEFLNLKLTVTQIFIRPLAKFILCYILGLCLTDGEVNEL